MTPLAAFAQLLACIHSPPASLNLADIAIDWPRPLVARLLANLPLASLVSSLARLPTRLDTARLGQVLRAMALDDATQSTVSSLLHALADTQPARAHTLRRDMEWEARDSAFFPPDQRPPLSDTDLAVQLAVRADACWEQLAMPNLYRLPGPRAFPDAWPETPPAWAPLPTPRAWPATAGPTAAIEWLHLWRLDAALAHGIRRALPAGLWESWVAQLRAACEPDNPEPLSDHLVRFEDLMDRAEALSILEVHALLRGVTSPRPQDGFDDYTVEERQCIRSAVEHWLSRAAGDGAGLCGHQDATGSEARPK